MNTQVKEPKTLIKKRYLPIIIFFVSIILYINLLLDSHLKWSLETVFGLGNSAEVNVDSLDTDFIGGSLAIEKIAFTNPNTPKNNRLEIGKLKFQLQWPALLRSSVIIDEASLEGISLNTIRETEGWVTPVSQEEVASEEDIGSMEGISKKLSSVFSGNSSTIDMNNVNWEELPSNKKIKSLEKRLQTEPKNWQKTIESLPAGSALKKDYESLKNIKFKGSPQEMLSQAKEAQKILKRSQEQLKTMSQTEKSIRSEASALIKDIGDLDKLVKDDVKHLKSVFKMPDIDLENIAQEIFGPEVKQYAKDYRKYKAFYDKYLGTPESGSTTSISNSKDGSTASTAGTLRFKGSHINFASKAYPSFWLKAFNISANNNDPQNKDLSGTVKDLTSQPKLIGKISSVKLNGDLSSENIEGIFIKGKMNAIETPTKDDLNILVSKFPISPKVLSKSEELSVKVLEGNGKLLFQAQRVGELIEISAASSFRNLKYDIQSKKEKLGTILSQTLEGMPVVTIIAKAKGPDLESLNWKVHSNLSKELQDGIGKEVKRMLGAEQDKIETAVKKRIENEKSKMLSQVEKEKGKILGQVKQRKDSAEQTRKTGQGKVDQAQKEKNAKKKAAEKKVNQQKEQLKKKLKGKLKGLGF